MYEGDKMKIASKINNRVSTYLLLFVLLAIFFASLILVLNSFDNNSLVYAEWEGDGSGTQDDPYLIGTKAELEKFRDITNGANGEVGNSSAWGKLTANIDLAGDEDNQWTPMGHYYAFNGTLDGCGFTISGLYINKQPYDGGYGLFETIGETGVVKNLTVEGTINITCDCTQFPLELWVGGIAAKNSGRISYCTNRVNISAVYAGNYSYHARVCTGGIVGEHQGSTYQANNIRYCVNEGNITGFRWTGGIVGKNRALIYSCCNKGNVSSTQADVGGIAGQLYFGLVENCYNVGNVTYGIGTYETTRAGGIAGEIGDEAATNCYYGVVTNSFNYGSVAKSGEGTATEIGGIAGYADRDASINNTVTIEDENIEPIGLKSIENTNTLSMYEYELAEFKTKTNFTDIGWDFFEKWKMEDNADYPTLIIGYDLYIDGELVTDEHMSGNGWTYDVGQTKLTLNNYSYKGPGYIRREYNKDASYAVFYDYMETLEINLIGTNEIINTNDSLDSVAAIRSAYCRYDEVGNSMSLGGLLKFTGNGTLIAKTNEVTGEYSNGFGINAYDSITINGGNITAFGSAYGIMAGNLITINDGIVNATGKSGGITVMNERPLIIGENAKSVVASGPNGAIGTVIKNSVAGVGWTDELGTEGENGIAINTTGAKYSEYKKIDFGVKYLVEFDKKGGEGGSNSARAIYGITTSSIAIPSKAGYVFDGYFDAETNGKKYYDANGASIEAWDRLEGATLYAYWEKKPEVAAVDNKIAAIGEVELTPECKQKIEEARAAYEALSPEDRPGLDYYNELIKAEEDYAALEEAHNNPSTPSQEQDATVSQEATPTPSQQDENKAPQNESQPEKKNNLGLIIGIIVGVVLIAGLLLWFFIFKKKKDDDNDDEPQGRNDTKKEVVIDAPNENIGENAEAATKAENESAKEDK